MPRKIIKKENSTSVKNVSNKKYIENNSTDNHFLTNELINKLILTDIRNEDPRKMESARHSNENKLQSIITGGGLETMIAAQMVAIHNLQLECATFAKHCSSTNGTSSYVNMTSKLSNAFIQQAQLLRKIQGKGQQKVTVEHVNVHEGGQAIVGNITNNPGVDNND